MLGIVEENSPEHFEELALPLAGALYQTAFRILGNGHQAEDIVQDTYVCAWEKFDRFKKGSNFKAWIFRILIFLCKNKVRKIRIMKSVERHSTLARMTPPDYFLNIPDAMGVDRTMLPVHSVDDVLNRAINKLDSNSRAILSLVSVAELSYEDCAEALQVSLGTVRTSLFRARKQLQDDLRDYALEQGYIRTTTNTVS